MEMKYSIIFQDEIMVRNWTDYGHALYMDSTFNMVNLSYSFFGIICVNGDLMSEICSWFITWDETINTLSKVFSYLIKKIIVNILKVFGLIKI